jgi:pimeloyl-ACP methyl ester carboxylesterase
VSSNILEKFVESDERSICYYVTGNKKSECSLFFLNGLYHGHTTWIKQIRHSYFFKNYKLIFLDYRGLGNSIERKNDKYSFDDLAKDVILVLDQEEIKKTSIIGYSVGGLIALWFVHKYQERIDKLILLNTAINVSCHGLKLIDGFMRLVNENVSLENIFPLIYLWNHSNEYLEKIGDMEENVCKSYAEYNENLYSFFTLLGAIKKRENFSPFVKEIFVPTLLLGSDEDVIFPISSQKELYIGIKNCQYHVVHNCGHASFVEKYKEVNSLIENFLKDDSFIMC